MVWIKKVFDILTKAKSDLQNSETVIIAVKLCSLAKCSVYPKVCETCEHVGKNTICTEDTAV